MCLFNRRKYFRSQINSRQIYNSGLGEECFTYRERPFKEILVK